MFDGLAEKDLGPLFSVADDSGKADEVPETEEEETSEKEVYHPEPLNAQGAHQLEGRNLPRKPGPLLQNLLRQLPNVNMMLSAQNTSA